MQGSNELEMDRSDGEDSDGEEEVDEEVKEHHGTQF